MEIGSEFWLDSIPERTAVTMPDYLNEYKNPVFTATCTGAITLLLQQIQPKRKSALLPAYICESVIRPFLAMGYECRFYGVDENLSPDLKDIKAFPDAGVFLHLGYYGFPTNSNLSAVLKSFKEGSTVIIEDVTHTLFSSYERSPFNDYYIGSLRKWFGIPSGGFLAGADAEVDWPLEENPAYVNKRLAALLNKGAYIRTNDMEIKTEALRQFSEAEELMEEDFAPYRIDGVSTGIISRVDAQELVRKRRSNFAILMDGVEGIDFLKPVFSSMDAGICPMFFPVLIDKEERGRIRSRLTEQGIYCPIHWPLPAQLDPQIFVKTMLIYDRILSIPCDQRYGEDDMKRIISVLRTIDCSDATEKKVRKGCSQSAKESAIS
ncbi:DegT/DnrJ/EryC1/StrS aminotransferase family protein [Planococcus sp. CAU13]|uniref:DegT/DnrJ/EryC1/StrS aminotransferase family protein n=1 Tax=Planococcus sp. CAU13 TaxID=1541197 RepID=UPI00052FE29F|nr:DegT/DnrJ/EryC1/StrS aminotransferase family protein [Planococcus sp. CAU13]